MSELNYKIGIIGQGFVGSAIYEGLKHYYDIYTYDLDETKCNSTHQKVCYETNIIFVCVPTPMRKSGECDIRILTNVIKGINEECKNDPGKNRPIIVIKSTVPPGTTKQINDSLSPVCDVCFSPEFLTEASSFEDFKNQTRIIIGDDPDTRCTAAKEVKRMFKKPFPQIPIIITKTDTAEMVKYFTNCFLTTKITFANEMYEICKFADIDYDKVCEYVLYDNRIGKSHLAVPGPDGDRGFGGHCFPKDLNALIQFAKRWFNPIFLEQILISNNLFRKNKDWLKMLNRAVSED